MMRQMRDNMKLIMLITAITFVGLMVFGWGMDITGRSNNGTGGELGRVNGEPISYQEWATAYRSLSEQQQRQNPGQPINAALNKQLENAAWDQLVLQKLVQQELKRRGIEVTESEIRQAARYAPPPEFQQAEVFQTNGQFDLDKYHRYLSSPAVDAQLLAQLEGYYRDVIPRSKLFYQVTSGTYLPESQMWRIWRDARESVRVRYIAIDPNVVVPDASVSVTEKEIKAYYDKNKDEFMRPATAAVRYATLDRAPTSADTAAALNRARAARQAALADFAGTATKESSDSVSARNGGLLGKISRGQTVPAFEQAAFSLPIGQVSEPVLTQFGYHIIKVESRTDTQAETRHILIPITRSPENENALLDRADSLENYAETHTIQETADRMGLRLRQSELNDSTPYLPLVGPADDAAQWVFGDGQPGEVSEVFETPGAYYLVEIVSKRPAGVMPLAEVRQGIRDKLFIEKKLEKAKEVARTVVDKIRAGATLDQAAQQSKLVVAEAGPFTRLEYVPGLGRMNAATGTAFGQPVGAVSGVVEADQMLYIVQTVEHTPASREEFDQQKELTRGRMTQALAEQRWNAFMAALKETAKIVDKRKELQQQAAAQQAALQ